VLSLVAQQEPDQAREAHEKPWLQEWWISIKMEVRVVEASQAKSS
jgi:hypothetical protein